MPESLKVNTGYMVQIMASGSNFPTVTVESRNREFVAHNIKSTSIIKVTSPILELDDTSWTIKSAQKYIE